MEAVRAVAWSADSDGWAVNFNWVRFKEPEMTWETVEHIHMDITQYLRKHLKKMN